MIEQDFLTTFQKIVEEAKTNKSSQDGAKPTEFVQGKPKIKRDISLLLQKGVRDALSIEHPLLGEERITFAQDEFYDDEGRRTLRARECPERKLEFDNFVHDLMAFAKKNCAYLKIDDENRYYIEVELKFTVVLGDFDYYFMSGDTLAHIFNVYRFFSLQVTPDNCIRLKFHVPLIDLVE